MFVPLIFLTMIITFAPIFYIFFKFWFALVAISRRVFKYLEVTRLLIEVFLSGLFLDNLRLYGDHFADWMLLVYLRFYSYGDHLDNWRLFFLLRFYSLSGNHKIWANRLIYRNWYWLRYFNNFLDWFYRVDNFFLLSKFLSKFIELYAFTYFIQLEWVDKIGLPSNFLFHLDFWLDSTCDHYSTVTS